MFKNVKAKKRLTQVLIGFVVVCMALTGSFLLLEKPIKEANAAERTVSIGSIDNWNSYMNSAVSGDIINATLTSDLVLTNASTLAAIKAGVTLNLNMNGRSIYKNDVQTDSFGFMSESYPLANTYWGYITNNGTLTLSGTGTIKANMIHYNTEIGKSRSDFGAKLCTINNASSTSVLNIGSGITVESYIAQAINSQSGTGKYADMFIYNVAIYNAGTVNTSGTIKAGTFSGGISTAGDDSFHYAFCYGIFGGTVRVNGGTIDSQAKAGSLMATSSCDEGNQMVSIAVGVYSNNAVVLGNTNITTYAFSWDTPGGYDAWHSGVCITFSAGVMYAGSNYPTIGVAVNISSTFQNANVDNKISATIPGNTSLGYTVGSKDTPSHYARRAYAVVGINSSNNITYTIGSQDSEKGWESGYFGTGSTSSGEYMENNENLYYNFNANMKYVAEESYWDLVNNGTTTTRTDAITVYQKESGSNSNETKVSTITNGTPGTAGTQFNVMYRYYNGSVSTANLTRVSHSFDKSIQATTGYVTVAGSTNYAGTMLDASSVVRFGGGAISRNSYYYEHASTTYERMTPATYAGRNINTLSHWQTTGTVLPEAGVSINAENTIVVYVNYILRDPTAVRVAVANKGTLINQYSVGSEFEKFSAVYTGAALVPGSDFEIGIIDMGIHVSTDTNETSDDTVVTSVYNITGKGSGSGNDATAVTYRYTTDQATWNSGLPKDVGTYYIEISVNADTTFAATKTYNRAGAQALVQCTITKSNATIDGDVNKTGIYGSTYGDLIPVGEYTVVGMKGEAVAGSWSYAGVSATDYPAAGAHTVQLVWIPAVGTQTANNYNSTTIPVSLTVEKRQVTVNVGPSTVTYGDAYPAYTITYENLASCDEAKKANWFAASVFEVNSAGAWVPYSAGLAVDNYAVRFNSFGGATDTNNIFTVNKENGTFAVQKRNIVYNAVAIDRDYNTLSEVEVLLNYVSGNCLGDQFDVQIATTGEMPQGADAGEGKAVNVITSSIVLKNSNNYALVIDNANAVTVNISKATPTGVAVEANPATVEYDSTKNLNTATTLHPTLTDVVGSWSWKTADTVPTCDVASYTAVFTPSNTNNYLSIEQPVTLTVEQKQVIVSVREFNINYGDAVPAISGAVTYTGFTGTDTFATVAGATGTVEPTTTYIRGASVGTYPISVVSSLEATNYYFTAQNSTITVGKRPLTITANSFDLIYGANTPELNEDDITVSGFYGTDNLSTLGGAAIVSTNYAPGATTGYVGGDYPVTVTGYTSSNYEFVYVDGKINVAKATLTVTPNSMSVTYGADAPQYVANKYYTITGFVAGDSSSNVAINGEPAITTGYSSGQNVGSYPVNVQISAMSASNYQFAGAEATLSVQKAVPNVVTAPNANLVNTQPYTEAVFGTNQNVQNPNKADMSVAGTFKLKNTTAVGAYSGGAPVHETAVFTPTDSNNYTTVEVTVYLIVNPKQITGTPIIQGSAMEGKTLTLNLDSMDPSLAQYYTIQWYVAGSPVDGAYQTSYVIRESDIDKVVHVVITANVGLGFTGTAQTAPTSPIIQALLETTAAQFNVTLPVNCEYDAFSHGAVVELADGYQPQYFGAITVKYNGSTTAPTNAGTYIVTVDVGTPTEPESGYDANLYYGPATGINVGTFTIEKAPLTVTVYANDKVYDGTTNASATMLFAGVKDEMDDVRIAEGSTFRFDNANVGQNKTVTVSSMQLIGTSSANYRLVIVPTTASITPATLTARASGVTRVYNGLTGVDVLFTNVSGYASVDSSSTVRLVDGTADAISPNAGIQTLTNITCRLEGISKDNYIVVFDNADTATVTITPATPNVTAPVISGVVYDAAKTLQNIDLSHETNANGFWQFNDLTIVPTVTTTRYSATFMSTNPNYTDLVADVTINVVPKNVVLTADDKTVTYGTRPPVFTITASGFTGEDTLADIGGSCTPTCIYSPGSAIGTYSINLNNALHDDNYTFSTVPGSLTVTPATLYVTALAENKTYDGLSSVTVNFNVVSGKYGNDDVALSFSTITGNAATANAGTTTVTYQRPLLVGEKAENYELNLSPASGVLTVVIAKADVAGVIFPAEAEVQFGYNLTYATFIGESVGNGTFSYENAKETVPGMPNYYNNYYVVFTPADARNYNSQRQIVPLLVTNCVLDYVVGVAGTPQQGEALAVVFTGMPDQALEYVKYQWFRKNSTEIVTINGATSDRYIATEEDIGYTLMVITYFETGDPFEFADSADVTTLDNSIEGIIGESVDAIKEIALSFWQRLINWIRRIIAAITGVTMGMGK